MSENLRGVIFFTHTVGVLHVVSLMLLRHVVLVLSVSSISGNPMLPFFSVHLRNADRHLPTSCPYIHHGSL